MTFNNDLIEFLMSTFKQPDIEAIKVIDILAAEDSVEEKVKKLQDFDMQNITSAIIAVGLASVHMEMSNGLDKILKHRTSKIEELSKLGGSDLTELIISLSAVMHTQSSSIRPFSTLLLLLPLLLSTRLFSLDTIAEFLIKVISTNNITMNDIIESSQEIADAFAACAENVTPRETLSIN